jgi:large subunit ribosomal protein L9
LFGAVTVADILDAVKRAGGPDIDKRRIELGNPIKSVGTHQVRVKVHDDVTATITLEVVAS